MSRTALLARVLSLAVVLPLLVGAVAILVMVGWMGDLPSSVVIHWGSMLEFGPPQTFPLVVAVTVPVLAAVFGALLAVTIRSGAISRMQKLLAVVSLATAVFVVGLSVALLGIQRPPTGRALVDNPTLVILGALAVGAAVGALGWFVLPRATAVSASDAGTPAAPLLLRAGERAVWMREATTASTVVIVLLSTAIALTVGVAVLTMFAGPQALTAAFAPFVVLLVLATMLHWNVRVDDTGLTTRGGLGIPRFHVPLDEIRSAGVVTVNPLVDFGGWGIRFGAGGRVGIVTRGGEALEVVRTDGRVFVVTVDDAAGAAALLSGLVASASPRAGGV